MPSYVVPATLFPGVYRADIGLIAPGFTVVIPDGEAPHLDFLPVDPAASAHMKRHLGVEVAPLGEDAVAPAPPPPEVSPQLTLRELSGELSPKKKRAADT